MGKKRILSVTGDLGFGGGENRLLSLARNIDRERFEHAVMTRKPEDSVSASILMCSVTELPETAFS